MLFCKACGKPKTKQTMPGGVKLPNPFVAICTCSKA